jgi:hypothetical protein
MKTTDIAQLHLDYSDTWDDLIGGIWLHAKGGLYTVTNIAVDSETKLLRVEYREVDEHGHNVPGVPPWSRPIYMWQVAVTAPSGAQVPRFERVTGGKDHLAELRAMRGL